MVSISRWLAMRSLSAWTSQTSSLLCACFPLIFLHIHDHLRLILVFQALQLSWPWNNEEDYIRVLHGHLDVSSFPHESNKPWQIHVRYFRHFLNIIILYSVWTEFDLIPCALFDILPEQSSNAYSLVLQRDISSLAMAFGWYGGWNTRYSSHFSFSNASISSG